LSCSRFGNIDNVRTASLHTYLLHRQIQNRNLSGASVDLASAGSKSQRGDKSQKRGDKSRQPLPNCSGKHRHQQEHQLRTLYEVISTYSTIEDPDPSNLLTTPKPDIVVGLARRSFSEVHQALLGEWQDKAKLLSEPQLVQHGLHFPFLLVEAKGLATSGNMMGAENQAAVGGACAINILRALQNLEPHFPLPHIIFSISTEGPLHQLGIHYIVGGQYQQGLTVCSTEKEAELWCSSCAAWCCCCKTSCGTSHPHHPQRQNSNSIKLIYMRKYPCIGL
jgi:hypothetical protein